MISVFCSNLIVIFNFIATIKFIVNLSFLAGFPSPFSMDVVHGLALDERRNRLFVADRENKRILIFKPDNGNFIRAITHKFDGAVYAVAFNSFGGSGEQLFLILSIDLYC